MLLDKNIDCLGITEANLRKLIYLAIRWYVTLGREIG